MLERVWKIILLASFWLPFAGTFLPLFFYRLIADFQGSSFDRFGSIWILAKSLRLGLITFLIAQSLYTFSSFNPIDARVILFVVALFILEIRIGSRSCLDRILTTSGYAISRIFPYRPQDRKIADGIAAIAPNTSVSVQAPNGAITITASHVTLRSIQWEGATRHLELKNKSLDGYSQFLYAPDHGIGVKQRLYIPLLVSEDFPGFWWKRHNGITRFNYCEGIVKRETIDECLEWFRSGRHRHLDFVRTSDGLVVGWSKHPDSQSIHVEVWQLLVDGKKPINFPNSTDGAFKIYTSVD